MSTTEIKMYTLGGSVYGESGIQHTSDLVSILSAFITNVNHKSSFSKQPCFHFWGELSGNETIIDVVLTTSVYK